MTDRDQPYDEILEPADEGTAPAEDAAPTPTDVPGTDGTASDIAAERDLYRDQALRARADFDNFRKRTERDRALMIARATDDVILDLLPIIDDLERALAADPGEAAASFHQGVELIHRQMIDLLARRGVEPIQAIGQDFDPNIHEAVAYEPAEGRREGEVIGELRRGYRMGDRLLRPSMVRVAQGVR